MSVKSSIISLIKSGIARCKSYTDSAVVHVTSDVATTEKNGFMSSDDKMNLDTGILKALRESTGAGRFNSVYRGKDLGLTTSENLADISRRILNNFEDLYCGDTLTGVTTRRLYDFAAADYHYKLGDTQLTDHHILVVPREAVGSVPMNDTNTTEGAYVGSKMFKEYLNTTLDSIISDFGEDHIIEYRTYLQNATTDGKVSGNAWYSRKLDLMNEAMVYGCYVYSIAVSNDYKTGNTPFTDDNSQLPFFRYRKDLIITNTWYALRDIRDSTDFAAVDRSGSALGHISASFNTHIRPYFLIR